MKRFLSAAGCLAISCFLLAACTKTKDLPADGQGRIIQYKVVNLPDTAIYGAIDHDAKRITVYVPFYYALEIIDPEIKVAEGSVLQGSIDPVMIDDSTKKYTVKGPDGAAVEYKLSVKVQRPEPLKADWASKAPAQLIGYPNNPLSYITGNFYTSNAGVVKTTLTAEKTGKKYVVAGGTLSAVLGANNQHSLHNVTIPVNADSGSYKVSVSVWGYSVDMSVPFRVAYKQPAITFLSRQVAQGGTVTYNVAPNNVIRGFKKISAMVNGVFVPLEIASYTYLEAVIKIPDNFPPGTYYVLQTEFEGYAPAMAYTGLTVTAK